MPDKLDEMEAKFAAVDTMAAAHKIMGAELAPLGFPYFDVFSLAAEKITDPAKSCRFYHCNYLSGEPWKYFPQNLFSSGDPIYSAMSVRHLPFDYVRFLNAVPAQPTVVLQRSLLKLWNISHAWVVPVNAPLHVQTVTCYMVRGSDDAFERTRTQVSLLSAAYLNRLVELYLLEGHDDPARVTLSAQEAACLIAITNGCKNDEIADRLGVSPNTVRYHLKKLFKKLGVANRAEAAIVGLRLGYGLNDT